MQPVRVEALDELRHQVAQIEAIAPTLADAEPSVRLGVAAIDTALGGGLPLAAVHELAPALPIHSGAAQGFAVALAALTRGSVLWVETDFARMENGAPYGPGLALSGLALERRAVGDGRSPAQPCCDDRDRRGAGRSHAR